jgi:hypothetical protein
MKTCNRCNIKQSKDNFRLRSTGYLYYLCKPCEKINNSEHYQNSEPKPITVEEKKCSKCNRVKRAGLFYANRTSSDGLQSSCKHCWRQYTAEYTKNKYSTLKARLERSEKNKMKVKETDILREILELSRGPVRLFRNNVGFDAGNKVRYGLKPGSSDLIGWRTIEITEHHIGRKVAVFAAIEVKTPTGTVKEEQQRFVDYVDECGGISGICRSVEEAKALLNLS